MKIMAISGHFFSFAGDSALQDHLASAPRNATYTSSDIQNQVIDILGDHIQNKILLKVKKAQHFTLVADEVTDSSNKEQLSLVLKYINPDDYCIREDLVTFMECDSGTSRQVLADMMITFLKTHGLDPTKLRGQVYDGAGNMSGKTNGAAALISSQYPLALYVHCASHCLNLAVVSSLEEVSIRNMIGVVNCVSLFFSAHLKRQRKLEEAVVATQPESSVHKLKDLCCTRWIEHIDDLDHFLTLHSSIVACMETISLEGSSKWSPDSLTDASTLLLALSTTDLLSALVITTVCLRYMLGLTHSLQAEAKDIVQAVSVVNNIISILRALREDVDKFDSKCFAEVQRMCDNVGVEPSLPRLCGRQCHRSNVPAQSPSEYYRRTITIPVLDHLLSQLETRFRKQLYKVFL